MSESIPAFTYEKLVDKLQPPGINQILFVYGPYSGSMLYVCGRYADEEMGYKEMLADLSKDCICPLLSYGNVVVYGSAETLKECFNWYNYRKEVGNHVNPFTGERYADKSCQPGMKFGSAILYVYAKSNTGEFYTVTQDDNSKQWTAIRVERICNVQI